MRTEILHRGWGEELARLIRGASRELHLVAPFISREGTAFIERNLPERMNASGAVHVVTDLDPAHVCDGVLDLAGLRTFLRRAPGRRLYHVPGLHAKVYIADAQSAIVTSGNLTAQALHRNVELGISTSDPALAGSVRSAVIETRAQGVEVPAGVLDKFSEATQIAGELQHAARRVLGDEQPRAVRLALRAARDSIVGLRLAAGPMHTVFARTVLIALSKMGPMKTPAIHACIQSTHPDLCDDTIDRVIEGKRFGKKWKHAVRSAQQQLKKQGEITVVNGFWKLLDTAGAS